jgi:sugar phosphate isomerase/epimerase
MDMYLSLSAYGGVTTRTALETIAAAGIDRVELAIGVQPEVGISKTIREFQQRGMIFRAHHAFLWEACHRPFNLAREIDRDYLQRMVEWLAKCGIQAYSVHPGSNDLVRKAFPLGNRSAAWQQMLQNLAWLQDLCHQQGITLGVETMYPGRERNFLGSLLEIRELRRLMPTLQWVLDLSHLNLWPQDRWLDRLEVIAELAPCLLEIHLSDNDGRWDRHQQITDQTWWLPWQHLWPDGVPYVLETRLNRQSSVMLSQEYQRVQSYLEV